MYFGSVVQRCIVMMGGGQNHVVVVVVAVTSFHRAALNARTPRICCVFEVYGYMIWRRCRAHLHTQRCSVWHTYDVFICALRCVCGAGSLPLKYLKHICMCDLTVSWSACAVLVARWCVLITRTSTLCAHMCGATLILCVNSLCLKLMLRGVTAMMAYMCSAPRKYVLVSAAVLRH